MTTTTTTSTTLPQWLVDYYKQQIDQRGDLYDIATNIYNSNVDYSPYGGQRLQGFTTDQLAAMGMTQDQIGQWQQYYDSANSALSGIQSYGQTFSPTQVYAGQYNNYYNPQQMNAYTAQAAMMGSAPQISGGSYNPLNVRSGSYNPAVISGQTISSNNIYAPTINSGSFGVDNVSSSPISGSNVSSQGIRSQSINAPQMSNYFVQPGSGIGGIGSLGYDRVNGTNVSAGTINRQDQVGSGNFDVAAAEAYMNPYTQTALRSGLDELRRQESLMSLDDAASATSAKAFGGTRQAIVDAERERNYSRTASDMIAKSMDNAYAGAQSQFNADQSRGLQAGQFNVGTEYGRQAQNVQNYLQAALANQGVGMQAQLANQGAGLQAGQFNINNQFNAQQFNAQQAMQAALANQQNYYSTGLANQNAGLSALQFNSSNDLAAQQYSSQAALQAALANQNNSLAYQQFNSQQALQAALANQQTQYNVGQYTTDAALRAAMANQSASMTAQGSNQQAALQAALANQANYMQVQGSNQNAMNTASQFNLTQDYNSQLANQAAYAQAQQFGLTQGYNAQAANQAAWLQTAMANQSATNQFSLANQQAMNAMTLANQQAQYQAYLANAQTGFQNIANDMNAQQYNAGMGLQAYQANTNQYNMDQNRLLGIGGLYTQMAPMYQQMGMQDINNLYAMGTAQQQFGQQNLNLGYQDYLTQQQWPYNQYAFLQGAAQGTYFNPLGGQTSTTTAPSPSALQQWGGLGIAGLGLLGGTGAFGSSGWLGQGLSSVGSWLGSFFAEGGEVGGDPFKDKSDAEILAMVESGEIPMAAAEMILQRRNSKEPAMIPGPSGTGMLLPLAKPEDAVKMPGPKTADILKSLEGIPLGKDTPGTFRAGANIAEPGIGGLHNAMMGGSDYEDPIQPDSYAHDPQPGRDVAEQGKGGIRDVMMAETEPYDDPMQPDAYPQAQQDNDTTMGRLGKSLGLQDWKSDGLQSLPSDVPVAPPNTGGIVPADVSDPGIEGFHAGADAGPYDALPYKGDLSAQDPMQPDAYPKPGEYYGPEAPPPGPPADISGVDNSTAPMAGGRYDSTMQQAQTQGGLSDLFANGRGWEALTMLGLGMMASKNPHALGAVGEAGLGAAQYLNQRRREDREQKRLDNQDRRLDMADKREEARMALANRREDREAEEGKYKSDYYRTLADTKRREADLLEKNGGTNSAEVARLNMLADLADKADAGDASAKRKLDLLTGARGENAKRAEAVNKLAGDLVEESKDRLGKPTMTRQQAIAQAQEYYDAVYNNNPATPKAKPQTPPSTSSKNSGKPLQAKGPNGQIITWNPDKGYWQDQAGNPVSR